MPHRPATRTALMILLGLLLGGCGLPGSESDAAVARTAAALGCWHADTRATPVPVTVTMAALPSVTPTVIVNAGAPTRTPAPIASPRPTTTALPRCTPVPGITQVAWPTPRNTPVPYPTQPPTGRQTPLNLEVLRLPDFVVGLDLAVHPTQGWPVIAAVNVPLNALGAPRVFVRAWRPDLGQWGTAQSVDTKQTHPGQRFRSAVVTVAPSGLIHTLWGASDAPAYALFAASSTDGGETWGAPVTVGNNYQLVLDAVTALDGTVYALALRRASDHMTDAVLLRRTPDGTWAAPEPLPTGPVWFGSSGALTLLGGYAHPTLAVALTASGARPGSAALLQRPLTGTSPAWRVQRITTTDAAGLLTHAQLLAYPLQIDGKPAEGLTASFTRLERGAFYAANSRDAGASWGPLRLVGTQSGGRIGAGAVAFDPEAQRLIAIWECCADATEGNVESTHYGAWADPQTGAWSPGPGEPVVPLISGARAAARTTLAHAPNVWTAWLAWLEDGQTVRVRAYDPDQIIPPGQYPTATAVPTVTRTP